MKSNLSYEFASKYMDFSDGVGATGKVADKNAMDPREQ